MAAEVALAAPDFGKLCEQLEVQEIESPGGVASADVYGQLLGLYLLNNDLPHSKFLWKRIPQSIKTASTELAHVWEVGQKLWQRDFPEVYRTLDREWPDSLKPIMAAVAESTRRRAANLVGQAYSSISAEELAKFVGLSVEEAVKQAQAEGWAADALTGLVTPVKPEKAEEPFIPSEQQMGRLTEFVSFLEN